MIADAEINVQNVENSGSAYGIPRQGNPGAKYPPLPQPSSNPDWN